MFWNVETPVTFTSSNSVSPSTSISLANVVTPTTLGIVVLPVTVISVKVGVGENVTVAIPFGCGSALAVTLIPRKSRVWILPAVPTVPPSSRTLKPFRILLTEKIPGTDAHSHLPPEADLKSCPADP